MDILKRIASKAVALLVVSVVAASGPAQVVLDCGLENEVVHVVEDEIKLAISFDDAGSRIPDDSALQKFRRNPVPMDDERYKLLKDRYGVDGIIGRDVLLNVDLRYIREEAKMYFTPVGAPATQYPNRLCIKQSAEGYYVIADRGKVPHRFRLRSFYLRAASNQILPNLEDESCYINTGMEFPSLPRFARIETRSTIEAEEKCNFGMLLVNSDEVEVSLAKGFVGMRDKSELSRVRYAILELTGIRFSEVEGKLLFPSYIGFDETRIPRDAFVTKLNEMTLAQFVQELKSPQSTLYMNMVRKRFELKTIQVEKDGKTWQIDLKKGFFSVLVD
jgi:hypothetical protein